MWELQQTLLPKSARSLQTGQTLVLIIDGADTLVGQHGQLISDWIPVTLPRVSVRRRWGWATVGRKGASLTLFPPFPSASLSFCPNITAGAPGAKRVY